MTTELTACDIISENLEDNSKVQVQIIMTSQLANIPVHVLQSFNCRYIRVYDSLTPKVLGKHGVRCIFNACSITATIRTSLLRKVSSANPISKAIIDMYTTKSSEI